MINESLAESIPEDRPFWEIYRNEVGEEAFEQKKATITCKKHCGHDEIFGCYPCNHRRASEEDGKSKNTKQ